MSLNLIRSSTTPGSSHKTHNLQPRLVEGGIDVTRAHQGHDAQLMGGGAARQLGCGAPTDRGGGAGEGQGCDGGGDGGVRPEAEVQAIHTAAGHAALDLIHPQLC